MSLRKVGIIASLSFILLAAQPLALADVNTHGFVVASKKKTFIKDDLPIGYASASEASKKIPKRTDIKSAERIAPGIMDYSTDAKTQIHWWVMEKGNEFYPSVVRRRVVVQSDGYVVKTAMLCNASKEKCKRLLTVLQTMDSSQ